MLSTELIPLDRLSAELDEITTRFLRDDSREFVDVEVLFPTLGAQPLRRGTPLVGLRYDRHTNAIEFMFESGDHRVYNPREVRAAIAPDGFISALEIVRADGAREVVEVFRYARRRIRQAG